MLIPIGLETSLSRFPRFTLGLIAVCGLIYLLQLLFPGVSRNEVRHRLFEVSNYVIKHPGLRLPPKLEQFQKQFIPEDLKSMFDILNKDETPGDPSQQAELERLSKSFFDGLESQPTYRFGYHKNAPPINLILSLFIHAGLLHLLGNMLLLYLVGIKLEDLWGGWVILVLFLVGGAIASLIELTMTPNTISLVGASGGIAALMGAFLVRLHKIRVRMMYLAFVGIFVFRPSFFTWPAYVVLPLWLLQQIFTTLTGTSGNVATWAHLGGFGFGVMAAFALRVSPFEKRLLTPEQQRAEQKEFALLDEAQGFVDTGFFSQAVPKFQQFLALHSNEPQAWEGLAKALRGSKQNPREAAFRAVKEYLESGQTDHAFSLLHGFGIDLNLRELAQIHRYLEPEKARGLLQQELLRTPDDPFAPKAALALQQHYPHPSNLETLQWVYEYTTDPDLQDRLKQAIEHISPKGSL